MNEEYMKQKEIEDEDQALIQVRKDAGGNLLHLQVYAPVEGNRNYGYADKFTVPPVVTQAVRDVEGKLYQSLATDSPMYFRNMVSVHGYSDGVQLHINAVGENMNSQAGYILDLPAGRFGPFIAFLEQVNLLINHEGEQRFVAPAQEEEE